MAKSKTFGKKPTGRKHTLTIMFDTKVGVENFMAWYLDGGGEQQSEYFTDNWGEDWMYLTPSQYACPECEYVCDDSQSKFFADKSLRLLQVECQNCNHKFVQKNPYSAPPPRKKK